MGSVLIFLGSLVYKYVVPGLEKLGAAQMTEAMDSMELMEFKEFMDQKV